MSGTGADRRTAAAMPQRVQGLLFGDELPTSTPAPATADPRRAVRPGSPTASSTTGPAPAWSSRASAARAAPGTQRLYSFRDILVLKVVKRLLDTGVSLQQIRTAVSHLRERGVEDLAQITLMSDGARVYECTRRTRSSTSSRAARACSASPSDGSGARSRAACELPTERAEDDARRARGDELAARRQARTAG